MYLSNNKKNGKKAFRTSLPPQILYAEYADYSLAFYIAAGFLTFTSVLILFLDVRVPETGERVLKSLKKIISPPALILFAFAFLFGFSWGIHDTYLFIYLQEDLGADSALISEIY